MPTTGIVDFLIKVPPDVIERKVALAEPISAIGSSHESFAVKGRVGQLAHWTWQDADLSASTRRCRRNLERVEVLTPSLSTKLKHPQYMDSIYYTYVAKTYYDSQLTCTL